MEAAFSVLEPFRLFVSTNTTAILMWLVVATILLVLFDLIALVSRRKHMKTLMKRVRVLQADVKELQEAANRSLLLRIREKDPIAPALIAPDPIARPDPIVVLSAKSAMNARGQDAGTTM